MKSVFKLVCIVSVIHLGYASAAESQSSFICVDRIAAKEKNVERMLAARAYYCKAFTAAKVGMSAYGLGMGVYGVLDFFGITEPYVRLSDVQGLLKKETDTFTRRTLRLVVNTLITTAAHLGFYYIFSKAEEQYGHAPEIRWFVTIKNPFYSTLRELYFLAQESAIAKNPEELKQEMNQLFGKLIDQTENIIAFMRHKKEQFPELRKAKAQQVIHHLSSRVEQLYGDIARALQSDAYNVTFHLDAVLMLLEGDCARFAAVERSSWINPSAILGMMQSMAS